MDPVTSLVIGHVAGKILDRLSSSFRTNVIERWSKYRARQFLEEFCNEVAFRLSGKSSDKLENILDHILEDEHATEILFDAYRSVSLSRSKTIGPRVIGYFTAVLVIEKREPTPVEESMMNAAEQLYDDELVEFSKFIRDYRNHSTDINSKDVTLTEQGILCIKWGTQQIDSNWRKDTSVSIAPLNLDESFGSWARKMNTLNIVQTDLIESYWDYQDDSESCIDEPGSIREITWWINIWDAYFLLAEIIDRVRRFKKVQNE